MLDSVTKRRIDSLRNILVGKVPDPKSQVDQITTGLIYKFMHDMDEESVSLGGVRSFFVGEYKKYSWLNLFNPKLSGAEKVDLYSEAVENMYTNPTAPQLFREIFKNSFLPFRDPSTLNMFLKELNEFNYSHSEKLGDAYEYLLSFMGSQGDAGQFRTPRHIIDFIVKIIDPKKSETILDPACGTAGFLISSFQYILNSNSDKRKGDLLSAEERKEVGHNLSGYDISPDMTRMSLVNMYLHQFASPNIYEYDTLSSEDRWNEYYDVILANPPFFSPKGGIQPHSRFGVQSTRAEVLFVDYIMEHLKPNGRAGIIVPEGVIFQTGKAYIQLRKQLVNTALVGVISLPAGVFQPYSGVKTTILILDKELIQKTDSIFFAKVENDGFSLRTQRVRVSENDLPLVSRKLITGDYEPSEKFLFVERNRIQDSKDISLVFARYVEVNKSIKDIFPNVSLGELVEIESGSREKGGSKTSGVPSIGGAQIDPNGKIVSGKMVFISENHFNSMSKGVLKNGDVLIVKDGATTGKVGFYFGEFNKAAVNEHVFILRCNERLNSRYLLYLLKTATFQSVLKPYIQGIIGGINLKVREIEIPLPPIDVQQEIVDELEVYQKIIDGCRQVVDNYKPTIDIDPSWETVELQNVCSKITDGTHKTPKYTGEGVPFLRVTDITKTNDSKKFISRDEHIELIRRCNPEKGDTLYSKNGTIGVAAYVDWDWEFSIFVSLCLLKPNKDMILPEYLGEIMNSQNVYRQAVIFTKSGTVSNLHLVEIKQINIPLPDFDSQQKVVDEIRNEQRLIEANKNLIKIYTHKIQDRTSKIWGQSNADAVI